MERYQAVAHIPNGSADATWQIIDTETTIVVCVIDPHQDYAEPDEVAREIAHAMNTLRVMA